MKSAVTSRRKGNDKPVMKIMDSGRENMVSTLQQVHPGGDQHDFRLHCLAVYREYDEVVTACVAARHSA